MRKYRKYFVSLQRAPVNDKPNYMKKTAITLLLLLLTGMTATGQKQKPVNDANTPLHLMKPAYPHGYGVSKPEEVKATMDRVLSYIASVTPAKLIDSKTKQPLASLDAVNADTQLAPGDFRLTSYEWGVTYSGVLAAYTATGDTTYRDYALDRFRLLRDIAPRFRSIYQTQKNIDVNIRRVIDPHALDDAGAVCSAMIKASLRQPELGLRPLIDSYVSYIMNKEYRLSDGTFARTRPHYNTVWLDDMFMGIPALALMGRLTGEQHYYDEAATQVPHFAQRMFVPEAGLFRHGWVENPSASDKDSKEGEFHPAFFWGRANGWALLTLCEVLDVLPSSHPDRADILALLRIHIASLASRQGKDGFWHQLLDRPDTYEETSCTAIYTYCMAHAINQGWVDALSFGPTVQLAWHAVESAVNAKGQVEGVCVGTGMGFDPAFYACRPTHVMAAHGYGPVIWAGAEIIRLLQQQHPKMNDSAVQFYPQDIPTDEPIFNVDGSTRF